MAHSILDSIKKKLGIGADYDVFDQDIIMHINTVFTNLNQLGIGPLEGFEIEDASATWDTYLKGQTLLNSVKTYVYLKVRLLFDPPATSFHIAAIEKQIQELEWRILIMRDEISVLVDPVDVIELPPDPEPPVVQPPAPNPTPISADVDGGGAELH